MTPSKSATRAAVALAFVLCGCGPKPEKLFPDFADQKGDLGAVALVADVVVVEDLIGSTEHVYLEDCKSIGEVVIRNFESELKGRGFVVDAKPLLCVGQVLKPDGSYRILSTPERKDEELDDAPIMAPPFYMDDALAGTDEARAAWASVLNASWAFEKKDDERATVVPEAADLKDELGSDSVFIVQIVGTKIPFGKQMGQALLSGLLGASASSGNFTFSAGVDLTQFSGTALKVTMIDCRSGEVLWSDSDYKDEHIEARKVTKMSGDLLQRLP